MNVYARSTTNPSSTDTLSYDQGIEFMSSEMDVVLSKFSIALKSSETKCHEHSSTIERAQLMIEGRVRVL